MPLMPLMATELALAVTYPFAGFGGWRFMVYRMADGSVVD